MKSDACLVSEFAKLFLSYHYSTSTNHPSASFSPVSWLFTCRGTAADET